MSKTRFYLGIARLAGVVCLCVSGCQWAPRSQLNTAETQNHALREQNQAQLAEIEVLKSHNRDVEDRLIQAERDLKLSDGHAWRSESP